MLTGPFKDKLTLLEFQLCQWQNNNTCGKISLVFFSGWEERGLHALVQRRLLRGVEGDASLRAWPAVSPGPLFKSGTGKTSQKKQLPSVTLNPELAGKNLITYGHFSSAPLSWLARWPCDDIVLPVVSGGVPQGTIMGPLFFCLVTNDEAKRHADFILPLNEHDLDVVAMLQNVERYIWTTSMKISTNKAVCIFVLSEHKRIPSCWIS